MHISTSIASTMSGSEEPECASGSPAPSLYSVDLSVDAYNLVRAILRLDKELQLIIALIVQESVRSFSKQHQSCEQYVYLLVFIV